VKFESYLSNHIGLKCKPKFVSIFTLVKQSEQSKQPIISLINLVSFLTLHNFELNEEFTDFVYII
jgi:hypothetical protein